MFWSLVRFVKILKFDIMPTCHICTLKNKLHSYPNQTFTQRKIILPSNAINHVDFNRLKLDSHLFMKFHLFTCLQYKYIICKKFQLVVPI